MQTKIKAVVFKTPRLRETEEFYARELGLKIIESSNYHFVIDAHLRLIFMKGKNMEVEMYLSRSTGKLNDVDIQKDVNGIKIIACNIGDIDAKNH
jgi:catechol-2,3-dioxygenase